MIPEPLQKLHEILMRAATIAQKVILTDVITKAHHDYVTNIDQSLEAALTADLNTAFPGIPVLSEERLSFSYWPDEDYWLIDPLDGTHNMIAGVPFTAITIAQCRGLDPVLAGVHDLGTRRTYVAAAGQGAFVDGERMRVPGTPSTLLGVSSGLIDRLIEQPASYAELRQMGKLRNFGAQSLHLVYVAEGKLDAALSEEARFWDDAAGRLIAQEAGTMYHSFATEHFPDAHMRSLCARMDRSISLMRLMTALWSKE